MPSMPSMPSLSFDDLSATLNSWKDNISELSTTISNFQTEFSRGPESLYQRIIAQRTSAEIHPETQWDAEVRLGTDLCVQERAFLRNRREWMRKSFAKLMEVDESEVDVRDLPVVAFAASGGGYRAMLNTIASLSAAEDAGILDCTSYIAGVSGSCWALNCLNSIGGGDLKWTQSHLRERVKEPFLAPETFTKLLDTEDPASRCLLSGAILKEASKGGELSLVDVYGSMVSTRIYVPSEDHAPPPVPLSLQSLKTSYQRRLVDEGKHPLPIYCSIRHDLPPEAEIKKKEAEGKTGQQIVEEGKWSWFETTPHEVSLIYFQIASYTAIETDVSDSAGRLRSIGRVHPDLGARSRLPKRQIDRTPTRTQHHDPFRYLCERLLCNPLLVLQRGSTPVEDSAIFQQNRRVRSVTPALSCTLTLNCVRLRESRPLMQCSTMPTSLTRSTLSLRLNCRTS